MISGTGNKRALALAFAILAALGPRVAGAQAATPEQKAAAEALFGHARELMKAGQFPEACPKLAESQRLDPGLGTMLYLADCYEHEGRIASAWSTFTAAAPIAHAAGDMEREQKARARAAALEPKVTWALISIEGDQPGVAVRGDGQPLDRALLGKPLPLDPGDHTLDATAPGKATWATRIHVDAAQAQHLTLVIPKLLEAAPPVATAPVKPAATAATVVAQPLETPSTPAHKAGLALIGVGLGVTAIGGILGAVVFSKKTTAVSGCRADHVCLPSSTSDLSSAVTLATGSTVMMSLGGAIFTAGLITTLATQSPEDARYGRLRRAPVVASLRLAPTLGPGSAGLVAGGSF